MENTKKLATEKKVVKIDDILPNPWNPNKMPDYLFEKMKKVIEDKGLFGSVFVRPMKGCYELLDGEHRVKALKELGYMEVPVECAIDEITDQEAKFWTIYFNNTKGKDDIEKRAQLFEELDRGQTTFLPFTEEEIENEKALFNFDFNRYDKQEEIEKRKPTTTFMVALTQEEYDVIQKCLDIAKQDYKQDNVKWLMEQAIHYLDVRFGTTWRENKILQKAIEKENEKTIA